MYCPNWRIPEYLDIPKSFNFFDLPEEEQRDIITRTAIKAAKMKRDTIEKANKLKIASKHRSIERAIEKPHTLLQRVEYIVKKYKKTLEMLGGRIRKK